MNLKQGFSLIQLSIAVIVLGLLVMVLLPHQSSELDKQKLTTSRMSDIENATIAMMARFGRRPCPASGQYNVNEKNFGREAGTRGNCTDNAGVTPDTVTGVQTPSGNVIAGTVPVKKLGLTLEHYFDGWGRPFTYVTDVRATKKSTCSSLMLAKTGGDVTIKNGAGATTDKTMYALLSHGREGFEPFRSKVLLSPVVLIMGPPTLTSELMPG